MFYVEIESTNQCNTRCLHCPHESVTRPMGKMEWNTFKTVADKALTKRNDVLINFAGMGEPLLNPLIYRFVEYVSDRAQISITTNASALTPKNIERLITAGLDRLVISFNGTDQESYELMMGGLSFQRAENNVRTAVRLSRDQRMRVVANVSVTQQSQKHLPEIKACLNRLGVDAISFAKCHNRGGYLNDPAICQTAPPPDWASSRCDIFSNTVFVAWTGDVLSCCHDLAGENRLGNLVTDELEAILAHRQRITEEGVSFAICKGCNDMYRYMHASTPDGSPLAEWIYNLYVGEDARTEFLMNQIHDLSSRVAQLEAQTVEKDGEIQLLSSQLKEIQASRSWRLLKRMQHLRLVLIPHSSRRESMLQTLFNWAGI